MTDQETINTINRFLTDMGKTVIFFSIVGIFLLIMNLDLLSPTPDDVGDEFEDEEEDKKDERK